MECKAIPAFPTIIVVSASTNHKTQNMYHHALKSSQKKSDLLSLHLSDLIHQIHIVVATFSHFH